MMKQVCLRHVHQCAGQLLAGIIQVFAEGNYTREIEHFGVYASIDEFEHGFVNQHALKDSIGKAG